MVQGTEDSLKWLVMWWQSQGEVNQAIFNRLFAEDRAMVVRVVSNGNIEADDHELSFDAMVASAQGHAAAAAAATVGRQAQLEQDLPILADALSDLKQAWQSALDVSTYLTSNALGAFDSAEEDERMRLTRENARNVTNIINRLISGLEKLKGISSLGAGFQEELNQRISSLRDRERPLTQRRDDDQERICAALGGRLESALQRATLETVGDFVLALLPPIDEYLAGG